MQIKASMISIGAYVPENILTNSDLEKLVETSDEWIVKRTGIKERRIAKIEEKTSDLGYKAALQALERSKLDKNEIDAVICATMNPDYVGMPSTAAIIADKLALKNITVFDITAACSGFVYLLELAKALIESGSKKNILIIGAEKTSDILNWEDRGTCILFGDGAGAAVISRAENENYIIDVHTAGDGKYGDLLMIEKFKVENEEKSYITMKGNEVFKVAVQTLSNDVLSTLEKNSLSGSDIDLFVPHQANLRIINAVKDKLKLKDDQCVVTVDKYGNTSAASIPMAINEAYEDGRLKAGDLVLLDAFGGGFTWGSALLRFDSGR